MSDLKVAQLSKQHTKREWQKLVAQNDPEGLFNIPLDDVCQYLDSANTSKSDPISLHGASLLAVKRLLTKFGIDETPTTYGQLMGALHYCRAPHGFINRLQMSAADMALVDEIRDASVLKNLPELYPSYLAHKTGDIEALRTIARTKLPLAVMSDYFRLEEGKHGSWVSNWRELWPPKETPKRLLQRASSPGRFRV